MAYNITAIKTKTLDTFTFPLSILRAHLATAINGYSPDDLKVQADPGAEKATLIFLGGPEIGGRLTDDAFTAEDFTNFADEWSGTLYREVLLPTFAHSSGDLDLILIWEGGDDISRLTVSEGQVTESPVEL